MKEFGLDKLIIVPMGDKYEKSGLVSFHLRYNMLKETFIHNNKIEISKMQENQTEKSYAIDSFEKINKFYNNSENYFIMGLDNFSNIYKWKESQKLIKNYRYIIFKRGNIEMPNYSEKIDFFEIPYDYVSSEKVRNRIKNNEPVDEFLCKNVIKIIDQNNLYK